MKKVKRNREISNDRLQAEVNRKEGVIRKQNRKIKNQKLATRNTFRKLQESRLLVSSLRSEIKALKQKISGYKGTVNSLLLERTESELVTAKDFLSRRMRA